MNRFSVIYLLKKQYHHISCATQAEAEAALTHVCAQNDCRPIGIYDAKTELFYWEPTRQRQYNKASIERQGKLGDQITLLAQRLRQGDEARHAQSNSISQLLQMNG
ncbi:hypothetical protein [Spirosoma areae]